MTARLGQALDLAKRIEHCSEVHRGNKRTVALEVLVKVARIGGQDHIAAPGMHSDDLEASSMAGRKMQRHARRKLAVTVIKFDPSPEVQAHHPQHVLKFETVAEEWITHMAAGSEGHFALLQMKARVWQFVKIANMVIMQVGQDHIRN